MNDTWIWNSTLTVSICGLIVVTFWTWQEWQKRKGIRIVSAQTLVHDRNHDLSAAQQSRTKQYLEKSLHYLSYSGCLMTFLTCILLLITHFYPFCEQFLAGTLSAICWASTKTIIILFQVNRFELCFSKTNGKYISNKHCCLHSLWYFLIITVWCCGLILVVYNHNTKNSVNSNDQLYCKYDSQDSMVWLAAGMFFALDWTVLIVFSSKIVDLNRKISKLNSQIQTQLRTQQVGGVPETKQNDARDDVKKKLYSILKRLLVLSVGIEVTTTLVAVLELLSNDSGFELILAMFDVMTNMKLFILMLQHNTKLSIR